MAMVSGWPSILTVDVWATPSSIASDHSTACTLVAMVARCAAIAYASSPPAARWMAILSSKSSSAFLRAS